MRKGWTGAAQIAALTGLFATVSCSGTTNDPSPGPTGVTSSEIVNGSVASAYPESVLLDMPLSASQEYACSGSIIAPQVVLTAGHCVTGEGTNVPTKWIVTAPYAGNQQVTSTTAVVYDWVITPGTINPNLHDIGLVFLPTPITLTTFPTLAQTPVASGSQVVNIGRIDNGTVSFTELYVSPSVTVTSGISAGYPYDYLSTTEEVQPGDSGGPDEVPGSMPHLIVAANSGYGSGFEALARVDLLYPWIEQQIAAHGGNACVPVTSCPSGLVCGTTSDGCSGTLDCGTCTGTDVCSQNKCVAPAEDAGQPIDEDGGTTEGVDGSTTSADAGAPPEESDSGSKGSPEGGETVSAPSGISAPNPGSKGAGGCSVSAQGPSEGGGGTWGVAVLIVAITGRGRVRRARKGAAHAPSSA
jgi:hypothetical protein